MATGTPLDQFEFLREIGKGSYGEVSLARHKRDRKQYVIKKILLKKASNRERRSAEQEAKLLSKLKHPNIVSYKQSFEKDGTLFIAMQYCEGGDLYTKLKERKGQNLEERQVVEWFVQIAMALQSDVWALGCCVYEMATLKHAFNAKDMNALVYKILKGKMPLMPKSYSPDLLQLIKSMLHQEPEKRPSVNRILRDPYIKKNISIFLEDTKKRKKRRERQQHMGGSGDGGDSIDTDRSEVNSVITVERPNSARLKLKPQRHESDRITKAEKSEPSIADDSSSSDEGTLKEIDVKRDRDKDRENKEMNNFITLLDTTLHMNREDDKSDDEAPNVKDNKVDDRPSESEIKRCASLPSKSSYTIDCVNGVGFDILHKAYQILQNIEDDEVEPQLVSLMGREKFDMYAGKIWQLKFCEECMGQLPHLS
ncbi:hypothetical protein KUTeg_021321 [Tegillarca granosa]|uniref:non-specific serine/threonine protein kinase n=1 Tax=Tegillarca granosa TaxID=220873 RepID=A0ABQ9EAE8_TEGGR|nr:hypothetical protein KUTeg_021321 [Tegillarca granosa]